VTEQRAAKHSLLIVVEVELALGALDHEGARSLLLDDARVDEVAHQDRGVPVDGGLLLHLLELVLDLIEPRGLASALVLAVEVVLGGPLQLLLGPAALRRGLQHVHADAVLDC